MHRPISFAGDHSLHTESRRGEGPGRFRGAWLHRSPPRPSALAGALEVPTTGLRVLRKQDRANPPDLDAGSPVTSRVTTARRSHAGHPLLGLSKDRPSIVPCRRVRRPVTVLPRPPSEPDCHPARVPPSWFLTTSAVCSSSTVQVCPAPDPGVHHVSPGRETRIPAALVLPFEAFPPLTATWMFPSPWARRHEIGRAHV